MRCETAEKRNFTIKGKFSRLIWETFFHNAMHSVISAAQTSKSRTKVIRTLHKCFLIFNPFFSCKYKKRSVYLHKHTVPFLMTKCIEQIPFPISVRQNLIANNVEKTVIKGVTLHRLSVIMP